MTTTSTTSTTSITSPSLLAAQEVASIINAWDVDAVFPTVELQLTPHMDPSTGEESVPAAYTIPISHDMTRCDKQHYQHDIEIALVVLANASTEEAAEALISLVNEAARAVLSKGNSSGVTFVFADHVVPFDYDLLAEYHIFRSQVNIACRVFD